MQTPSFEGVFLAIFTKNNVSCVHKCIFLENIAKTSCFFMVVCDIVCPVLFLYENYPKEREL